jgi:hypothetical protein
LYWGWIAVFLGFLSRKITEGLTFTEALLYADEKGWGKCKPVRKKKKLEC